MIAKIEAGTRRIDAVELVRLGTCLDVPLDHFLHEAPAVPSRRGALVEEEAREAATWLRERFGYGHTSIPSLMAAGEWAGQPITVIDLPDDGACVVDGDIAVAVVSRSGNPGRVPGLISLASPGSTAFCRDPCPPGPPLGAQAPAAVLRAAPAGIDRVRRTSGTRMGVHPSDAVEWRASAQGAG